MFALSENKHPMFRHLIVLLIIVLALGCTRPPQVTPVDADAPAAADTTSQVAADTPTEAALRAFGLVDIQEVDTSIRVHLMYATPDNFTGEVLYDDLHKAFLLPEMAEKVALAQQRLSSERPGYHLIIYDAARPLPIQRRMWDKVKGTPNSRYVSNPNRGRGLHNYGAAVDISILDAQDNPLDMGTPVDFFGPEAHITLEDSLVAAGRLTAQQVSNRRLLRRVMREAGLRTIPNEWWHFNLMSGNQARQSLKIIE